MNAKGPWRRTYYELFLGSLKQIQVYIYDVVNSVMSRAKAKIESNSASFSDELVAI